MIRRFTFVSPTASADGYGASGEALALAGRRLGADFAFVGYGSWRDERFTHPDLLAMKEREDTMDRAGITVVYFLPYALDRFQSATTINQTMFESSRIPDVWAALIDRYADGVIVPSEFCRLPFERAGKPVEVIAYGTDTDLYTFKDRGTELRDMGDGTTGFVFAMVGRLHYRKGAEFAVRAFREEFAPSEPVHLWLKTRCGELDVGDETVWADDPRITVFNTGVDNDYTREQMVGFYHDADCLLAPSRGEGSGLTPRDAMATGLPVILTDGSGLAELADERYAYPVPVADLEPVPDRAYDRNVVGGDRDLGCFVRPDLTVLRAQMRAVYEDRAEARRRGLEASLWMRRQWTWDACARKWLAAIETLAGARVP